MRKARSMLSSGRRRGASLRESLLRVSVGTLVTVIVLGPFTLAGAAEPACSDLLAKDWVSITVPDFPSGGQSITKFVVSPTDPRLLYVTNGHSVLSSRDGGCSFRESFNIEEADLSYDTEGAVIKDLHLGSKDAQRAYLAIEATRVIKPAEGLLPVEQKLGPAPHVLVTTDGGAAWREGDQGLGEAFGSPLSLASTPDSQNIYLLVDEAETTAPGGAVTVKTPQRLYGSNDGGASWTQRSQFGSDVGVEPGAPSQGPFMDRLLSDPVLANDLLLFGSDGLYYSADGGRTVNEALALSQAPVAALDVFRRPDDTEPPRLNTGEPMSGTVIGYQEGAPQGFYSATGPVGLQVFPEIATVRSVAIGNIEVEPFARFAIATSAGDVYYRHPEAADPMDISVAGRALADLEAVRYKDADIIYARTLTTIERRVAPPPPPPPDPFDPKQPEFDLDEVDIPFGVLDELEDPKLTPPETEVALEPRETLTVDHLLLLPGSRKVDVVYLMDVSASMGDELNGLVQSAERIRKSLSEKKIDAHFGLGIFRSYGSALTYERLLNIEPPGPRLANALNSLEPGGGGPQKTHLAGLYQLATGAGQDDGGAFIAAGQQMDFREDALRIVVHGTDEAFVDERPSPTFAEAASALRGLRAHQVGLSYENESNPLGITSGSPTEDLRKMASATDAVAPPEGADCGGGNLIPYGAPLVCVIPSAEAEGLKDSIGTAIVKLVLALEDKRTVSLEVTGATEGVLLGTTPETHNLVDFKEPTGLPFATTVTCPEALVGETHEMTLTAKARGVVLGSATLTVVCEDPINFVPPTRQLPVAGAAVFPPISRPPPPPQAPQAQSPVQQIQAQTQSQSQAQAQAGLVTQRQSQPQVAAVKVMKPSANLSKVGDGGGDDLSFSSYEKKKHGSLPPYLGTYVAAAAMGTAFGLVTRVRVRRALVRGGTRGSRPRI